MTLDELLARAAIARTMAKCAQAGDSLRAAEYAACFAEDGVLQTESRDGSVHFRHEGRATILAWQERWKSGEGGADTAAPRATFVRHNLTTSQVTLTGPDSARARTYFFVVSDNGPDHSGVYTDRFVRVGDEWLIAERRVRTEWNAAASLFVA
jgi:SnoaL-like domain